MTRPEKVLVCFAVPQEATACRRLLRDCSGVRILITGMGTVNVTTELPGVLESYRPDWVISSGFAGGINPELPRNAILHDPGDIEPWRGILEACGSRAVRFYTADRIVSTRAEKARLLARTGADAVEMESGCIRSVCRGQGIPCGIVRVISDTAQEDLPLDFNSILDARQRISPVRLAGALLRQPGLVVRLIRLNAEMRLAGEALAVTLGRMFKTCR